jgi:hypothetical protein
VEVGPSLGEVPRAVLLPPLRGRTPEPRGRGPSQEGRPARLAASPPGEDPRVAGARPLSGGASNSSCCLPSGGGPPSRGGEAPLRRGVQHVLLPPLRGRTPESRGRGPSQEGRPARLASSLAFAAAKASVLVSMFARFPLSCSARGRRKVELSLIPR